MYLSRVKETSGEYLDVWNRGGRGRPMRIRLMQYSPEPLHPASTSRPSHLLDRSYCLNCFLRTHHNLSVCGALGKSIDVLLPHERRAHRMSLLMLLPFE